MKSYTHAGVSKLNGVLKVRYANSWDRVKDLAQNWRQHENLIVSPAICPATGPRTFGHYLGLEHFIHWLDQSIYIRYMGGSHHIRSVLPCECFS